MVSAGKRDDARATLVSVQLDDAIVRAAKLERAHSLKILAFEKNLRAGARVQRARGHHGCTVRNALQPPRRSPHMLDGYDGFRAARIHQYRTFPSPLSFITS